MNADDRKAQEREFHNLVRDEELRKDSREYEYRWSNRKFYSVAIKSREVVEDWLKREMGGKTVLDFCTGNGLMASWMAGNGAARVVGIDISDLSIRNAEKYAGRTGVSEKCEFTVMDAENMEFERESFDLVYERGVLHHLDLERAYGEIARVLKRGGKCLCVEALKHNPIMQWYRRKTPQLRTPWEVDHILGKGEIQAARKYFNNVDVVGCYYLFSFLAVPFRNSRFFKPLLRVLEKIDSIVLRLPFIKWQAWHVVFVLDDPKRC